MATGIITSKLEGIDPDGLSQEDEDRSYLPLAVSDGGFRGNYKVPLSWLGGKFRNISEILNIHSSRISTNASNISTNASRISTNASSISTNASRISSVENRLAALENRLALIEEEGGGEPPVIAPTEIERIAFGVGWPAGKYDIDTCESRGFYYPQLNLAVCNCSATNLSSIGVGDQLFFYNSNVPPPPAQTAGLISIQGSYDNARCIVFNGRGAYLQGNSIGARDNIHFSFAIIF